MRSTKLLFSLVVLFLLPLQSSVAVTINPGFSGTWYNPDRDGEGVVLEVSNGMMITYWYTYDYAGNQMWLVGAGAIKGDTATVTLQATQGGVFGPTFNPESVKRTAWGTVTLSFADCSSATLDYNSRVGFDTGSLNLTRLTSIDGSGCYEESQMDRGMIAHWPLDGNIRDAVNNQYDGGRFENLTYETGIFDEAASFDGSAYISTGIIRTDSGTTLLFSDLKEGTVSAWVRIDDYSANETLGVIMEQLKYFRLAVVMDGAKDRYTGHDRELEVIIGDSQFFSNRPLGRNQWHHIAVTWGDGVHALFIDGEEVVRLNADSYVSRNTYSLIIGSNDRTLSKMESSYLYGAMDDIRIYNRALAEGEIRLLAD